MFLYVFLKGVQFYLMIARHPQEVMLMASQVITGNLT